MPDNNKSILSFYAINHSNVDSMTYKQVWNQYIMTKSPNILCTNIVNFDISQPSLSHLLRYGSENELSDVLIVAQKELTLLKANFMFILPIYGPPTDGIYIDHFLSFPRNMSSNHIVKPSFQIGIPR